MGIRSFAAYVAVLDVFFGIVPGAATRGHRDGEEQAGDNRTDQQSAQRTNAGPGAHQRIHDENQYDRHQHRQQ